MIYQPTLQVCKIESRMHAIQSKRLTMIKYFTCSFRPWAVMSFLNTWWRCRQHRGMVNTWARKIAEGPGVSCGPESHKDTKHTHDCSYKIIMEIWRLSQYLMHIRNVYYSVLVSISRSFKSEILNKYYPSSRK